jgi:hypothetical protein
MQGIPMSPADLELCTLLHMFQLGRDAKLWFQHHAPVQIVQAAEVHEASLALELEQQVELTPALLLNSDSSDPMKALNQD